MRSLASLLAGMIFLLHPGPAAAVGTAYLVRSPSAGIYERPNAPGQIRTLVKGQVVTVLQSRGEWLNIITEEGVEGWVREKDLSPMTAVEEESSINESAPDEAVEAVYYEFVVGTRGGNIRREPKMKGSIVRTAVTGETLAIIMEKEAWYQVAREGKIEGWIHRSVGEKRESRNLSLLLLDVIDGKLAQYDQVKSKAAPFQRRGWFPSFFLRQAESDLIVETSSSGDSTVTVHLSCARRDVEYNMIIDAVDAFYLPGADRVFFGDLLLSIFSMSPEISQVEIRFWFARLSAAGEMVWESQGEIVLLAEAARQLPSESDTTLLWESLDRNTIPPDLWNPR